MKRKVMCIIIVWYTHKKRGVAVRTNIVIDDRLMNEARALSGNKTKKETVEEALKVLIQFKQQSSIRSYRGKLKWEGDLEKMRTDS